jgi:hypothetical protein
MDKYGVPPAAEGSNKHACVKESVLSQASETLVEAHTRPPVESDDRGDD